MSSRVTSNGTELRTDISQAESSNNNVYSEKDVAYLANTFTVSAVAALQEGGQREWIHLRELLLLIPPVGSVLLDFSAVIHYLQRIAEHLNEHSEQLGDLNLLNILNIVFPEFKPKSCTNGKKYPKSSDQNSGVDEKGQKVAKKKPSIKPNPLYQLDVDALERKLQPKLLKLTDIYLHLPRVVSAIAKYESVWTNCLGLTLVAANTNIPCEIKNDTKFSIEDNDIRKTKSVKIQMESKVSKGPRTGFEVIESLVRYHSVDMTRIWYLNLSQTVHYRPYDLIVVSKNQVESEHFVISVFGVLHVKPNGESELISLGQWYREATLYKTITKIRYFKTYLVLKSFKLWRSNVKFLKFSKIRKKVKDIHLLEVPSMREAILKINQLLREMESISLFPFDDDCCYRLENFTSSVNTLLLKAQKYTEKLYSHCQKIVSKVQDDCLEYLTYCQFELAHKSDNIKESMTVAKQRQIQQTNQLCLAKYIVEKLPCFVQLVKLILEEFMIEFVSRNIAKFVFDIMQVQSEKRRGLFYASFGFDSIHHDLVMSPSPVHLETSLKDTVNRTVSVLSHYCVPLVLPTALNTETSMKERDPTSSVKLTTKELQTLLNCGAKEAREHFKNQSSDHSSKPTRPSESRSVFRGLERQEDEENDVESLRSRINSSQCVRECFSIIHALLEAAFAKVEDFKQTHEWISNIHEFVSSWNHHVLESWKGQSASKIEKQVQQIRTWIDRVEHVDRSFQTSNGLLFVDASGIQDLIVPGLEEILTQLMDMTAQHCLQSSEELINELNKLSKRLSIDASTLKEFTSFYVKLKKCREEAIGLHNRVEYTNSIFEVVRHCYRQLSPEEEEAEQKLHASWDSFQYALQGANDRFNSLSPQMLENLEKTLIHLEGEAQEITGKVTSGKFLNSDENPDDILPELKELHERFSAIKEELLNLVKCKEIVSEVPHDLTSLESMHARIIARHELWKYCEVSFYTIKDWLSTPFYKLQVKKVIEKVTKWKEAAAKLSKDIPLNDEVLQSWIDRINDFGTDLPLLLELSSVPLKARHWKWLFAGLGQIYNQSYQYLVVDLVNMDLRDRAKLVMSICDGAAAEHALETHLKKLIRKWEEEEFKLVKHFRNQNKFSKRSHELRREQSKLAKSIRPKLRGAASSINMFILTGVNELQSQVEDNLVTLQSMLVSPNLAENTSTAETWSGHLHQLKEILDLWINCQQKWLYLGKIFSEDKMCKSFSEQQKEYEEVDLKYKEHMSAVLKDPKVLSVLEKKRGEKGFRDLQGENLRTVFFELITKEENIIKSLSSYLEGIRSSFPRLYFLSDNNMLELLASTSNPKQLVPFVKKCFPGISNLKFVLPQSADNRVRTQLDVALNAHKLEVVSFYGEFGEEIKLPEPIRPSVQTENWLRLIEQSMKSVMWTKMGQCIEERMLFTPCVKQLLKGIGMHQDSTMSQDEVLRPTSARKRFSLDDGHKAFWYVVYPFQCVVAAEEVIWTSKITKAVTKDGLEEFADVREWVKRNVEQYSLALQSSATFVSEKLLSKKAYLLLQSLLTRSLHHRDLTQSLDKPDICKSSFEWMHCLKYQIELSHDKRKRIHERYGKIELLHGGSNAVSVGALNIKHLNQSIPYGYEYHGSTTRMIMTPMTERCVLSLTTAFKMRYTGMVHGQNHTGKTETIRELSKILGAHLVTFSCSGELPLSKILHFLCGAIQSGSLICFENATRLPCTILSVLGQHLDGIRQALQSLERNKVTQYELRRGRETNTVSDLTSRTRGATVISLHTLTLNQPGELDYEQNEQVRDESFMGRRHSVAEIVNLRDPRTVVNTNTKNTKLNGVKSEMKLTTQEFDKGEDKGNRGYESPASLGNVMFAGQLMKAHPLFGCFMTIRSSSSWHKDLPDNLRSTMRTFSMVLPEYKYIVETLLLCHGFKTHAALLTEIVTFKIALEHQFFDDPVCILSVRRLRDIAVTAGNGYKEMKQPIGGHPEGESPVQSQITAEKIEEYCIGQAIHAVMSSSINPLEYANFVRLLKVSFPACKDSLQEQSKLDELLLSSIKEQLVADSHLDKKEFVDKVMQLHETMHRSRSIILLGDSGSGKTVCYQTLVRALCQFYSSWSQAVKKRRKQKNKELDSEDRQPSSAFSQVNLSTLYHKAMTSEEMFGGIDPETGDFCDGLLSKLLRNTVALKDLDSTSDSSNSIQYWFVFDGQLDDTLTSKLESLLDGRNELCLMSGERIKPADSVRFLFETSNLRYATPAIISLSTVVNFDTGLIDWTYLFHTWKKSARNKFNISRMGLGVVEEMISYINKPLQEFIYKHRSGVQSPSLFPLATGQSTSVSVLGEISSILNLLTGIFDRFLSRENAEKAMRKDSIMSDNTNDKSKTPLFSVTNVEVKLIGNAFAFSFVWAVAGRLCNSVYRQFDTFTRQLFATCPITVIFPCSVFDTMFDSSNGELVKFQEKSAEIPKFVPSQNYTISPEIEKYFTIADLLISSGSHVLIAGDQGAGKSSFVKNLVASKHKLNQIHISQGLSSKLFQQQVQTLVLENQIRHRANPLRPPPQTKGPGTNSSLFFIDDLNLASFDQDFSNSQPTLEVLREIISEGGVYDRERKFFQHLPHLQIIAACVDSQRQPRSNSDNDINNAPSPRLTRRMSVINMIALSDESLYSIYTSVYKAWLEEFPAYSLTHIEPFAKALAFASVDIYNRVKRHLISSPSHPHFVFSQHDLARISKGVFIYSPKSRVKPNASGLSSTSRVHLSTMESMPEIPAATMHHVQDISQSTTSVSLNQMKLNTDYTPAAVSPLIRVIMRLWCHEVCRSFYDRIIDKEDKQWFSSALNKTVDVSFCGNVGEKTAVSHGPAIILKESSMEKKANKNRVKFKDIETSRQLDYRGPLISFKHLVSGDALTEICFSKHLFIYGTRGVDGIGDHEKGYVECTDEHLEEALRKSLNIINSSQDKRMDLILYRDLLHQAVRFSRILALSGGHALLISLKGHGRANIVKLVAKLANIKVMNVTNKALKCRKELHSMIKDACFVAGLQGKPIVLFIPEGLTTECWQDVAALINEGTCPGLYTPDELSAIGNHLLPGGQVGQRRTENKTVAQERFLRRIRSNLHVVMCVWYGALPKLIHDFPLVLSRVACVDVYKEWKSDILAEVAEKWLIEKGKNEFFYRVPWNLDERERQLDAIYALMAQIHLTCRAAFGRDFRELGLEVFSPLKFIEFVDLFRTLCNTICHEKEEELSRLRSATDKVEKGKQYIEDVESRIQEISPLLEESRKELANSEASVKAATNEYRESRDSCDDQQKQVDDLEIPLAQLREEAHEELGKLSPIYEAAMKALQSLDVHDIDEIRSYRSPPQTVIKVVETLCFMFNLPANNWEDAKQMLIRDNFFQDLLFYKKDDVSDSVYKKLKAHYEDPEVSTEKLKPISQAVSSLSSWIRAVYEYCNTLRCLGPKKKQLKEAEQKLNTAKAVLGERRVRSIQLKSTLESEIELFKDNMKKTRALEKQIQALTRARNRANGLLGSMNLYIDHWKERTAILLKKITTAPGDSLLIAATVCYLGTFNQNHRNCILDGWLRACRSGIDIGDSDAVGIPVDENFSAVEILSSDDEQIHWKKIGLSCGATAMLNGLITRTCCFAAKKCWPMIIDPDDQATRLIRGMENGFIAMSDSLEESHSSTHRPARTLLSAVLLDKVASVSHSVASRPTTKCNNLDSTQISDGLHYDRRSSTYSRVKIPKIRLWAVWSSNGHLWVKLPNDRIKFVNETAYFLDDVDEMATTTPEITSPDSAVSGRRPKTAYSTFSAITNESVFLKKFYAKAGLKDAVESLPSSPLIDLDVDVLLVVDADNDDIDRKLKSALSKGQPTLVTHLERGIHGSLLGCLLNRNISVGDDGCAYLAHGKRMLDYHPNFRLYLSASVQMSFNKTNRFVLPLHKSIIVNMAMGRDELTDHLVSLTISSERPELESQRRSLDLDLFYLTQEKRQIQDKVLDMIIALPGKILDETTLPEIMAETKEQLNTTQERYDEVKNFKKELEEKRADYYQVAAHASGLYYNVVQQVVKFRPYYDMPLFFFIELFKKMLKQSKRSKAESGSVATRAAELNAEFTMELFKRICLNIFEEHFLLYPMLVIAYQLLQGEEITEELYRMFLTLIVTLDEKVIKDGKSENLQDFQWLSEDIVNRIALLAQFKEFENILESLQKQESQWKEYFDGPPNMICLCPKGFHHLKLFHKAMLWIAVKPNKALDAIHNLILCHLGPSFSAPVVRAFEDVYDVSEPTTPILILQSNKDKITTQDPAIAIGALGRSLKTQVVFISLGSAEQLLEAVRTIKDAIQNGYWLVLQNCHMENAWSTEFLRLIEEITSLEEDDSDSKAEETNVHKSRHVKFRLWLIMHCCDNLKIPVALARKGLRIAWDKTKWNTRKLPLIAYTNLSKVGSEANTLINELSLLHYEHQSANSQSDVNDSYYQGSTSDLRFGVELIAELSSKSLPAEAPSIASPAFERLICQPLSIDNSAECSMRRKIQQNEAVSEYSTSNKAVIDNDIRIRIGSDIDVRPLQRAVEILLQVANDEDDDDSIADTNIQLNAMLPELQAIYDSLCRKSSNSSKALHQFFYREIRHLRKVCWKMMIDVEALRNTIAEPDNSSKHKSCCFDGVNMNSTMSTETVDILLPWLRKCSSALLSYIRPRSRQPLGFELGCISHPRGLFASLLQDHGYEKLIDISSISWECKLLADNESLLPAVSGTYLRGFHLENGVWDFNDNLVRIEKGRVTPAPILHLIPRKKDNKTGKEYPYLTCPLIIQKGKQRIQALTVNIHSDVDQSIIDNNCLYFVGSSSVF
eukprot:gene3656-4173_t